MDQVALSEVADVSLILCLIATAGVATYVTRLLNDTRPIELLVNAAACLVLPLVSRLAYVVLSPSGMDLQTTLMLGWMSYSVLACAIALRLRWNGTAALAGGVALLAACAYFLQIVDRAPAFGSEVALALSLLANLGFAAFTIGRRGSMGMSVESLVTTAGFVVLPVFSRLSWVCLTQWGVAGPASLVFAWTAFAIGTSALVWNTRWAAPTLLAWSCVAMALALYASVVFATGFGTSTECSLLIALLGSLLAATAATCRTAGGQGAVMGLAAGMCWALFSRLAVVVLTSGMFGMPLDGAVTLSWVLYAAILMILGFSYHLKLFRYWGFAVFGVTLCKVALVDMGALDPAIRVGVLMLFGLAMLGAGYWYVRNKGRLDS